MPSLPKFTLSQTDTSIVIRINLPFIRVSKSETQIDGPSFTFSCPPYLLKLNLPGNILDDEESPAVGTYDPNDENGVLTCTVKKEKEGEFFEDLDLTTKLLQISRASTIVGRENHLSAAPSIEVLESSTNNEDADSDDSDDEINVAMSLIPPPLTSLTSPKYGFNNTFTNCFTQIRQELKDMCECHDMDDLTHDEKRALRTHVEKEKFDEERYCGDFYVNDARLGDGGVDGMDDILVAAVEFIPHWLTATDKQESESDDLSATVSELSISETPSSPHPLPPLPYFTTDENTQLFSLLNKDRLISPSQTRPLLLGLIDILFGYAYDHRLTLGETNVETPWTVSILSCTLSWFESWTADDDSISTVVIANIRRSLIYPYLRYYNLSKLIVKDVLKILKGGRRAVLRCLLSVHRAFERSDVHYMLNKFYLNDYCLYVQKLSDEVVSSFCEDVGGCMRELGLDSEDLDLDCEDGAELKGMVGLGLEKLERSVLGEEDDDDDDDDEVDEEESEEESEDEKGDKSKVPVVTTVPRILIEELS